MSRDSVLQLKMAELFFHYNQVQNIILRLLFIAVVASDVCFTGCLATRAQMDIVLYVTRRSYGILIPTEIQRKKQTWQYRKMIQNRWCVVY